MKPILSFPLFRKLCEELNVWNHSSDYIPNSAPVTFTYGYYYGSNAEEKRKEGEKKDLSFKNRGWYAVVQSHYGTEGGNCWGGEADQAFSNPTDSDDLLLEILLERLAPNTSFLEYRKILRGATKHDFEQGEECWYGNSSRYAGYYYDLTEIYNLLLSEEVILKPPKEAVLIGGLPCAGKTTLAKEEYKDYFLIDDPETWGDVKKHLRKTKIVIADPYLSFKDKREDAANKLRAAGFEVSTVLLKVNKKTLEARAKKAGQDSKLSFIRDYKLEP